MAPHAVRKTWPEGLSGQKPRPCFSHGMGDHDQIILLHARLLSFFRVLFT